MLVMVLIENAAFSLSPLRTQRFTGSSFRLRRSKIFCGGLDIANQDLKVLLTIPPQTLLKLRENARPERFFIVHVASSLIGDFWQLELGSQFPRGHSSPNL